MTTSDIRGIFSLPDDNLPRPVKKQKKSEPRPENVSRELHGLWGDRAPPIAITEHYSQSRVREKPKWGQQRRVQPWDMAAFANPARSDGLVLKHWKRRKETSTQYNAPTTPAYSDEASEMVVDGGNQSQEPEDYHFAKFNVKVDIPRYDDQEYNEHLESESWTREETDYLFATARDFDLRWVLIADRYEYKPPLVEDHKPAIQERSMEDLKARYYQVCSKIQLLRTPLASMSTSEFAAHEKTTKYDPEMENKRKTLAQNLMSRTPSEVQEEENLLIELKRIALHQEQFAQERAELHARLEYPQPQGGTQSYQSSQDMSYLVQTLAAQDRNRKRRSLLGQVDSAVPGNNSVFAQNGSNPAGDQGRNARTSMSGPGSAISTTRPSFPPNHPGLPSRDYAKFGVSKHDRLTAGVLFRNDRITKLLVPKPNTQTMKIKDALRELGMAPKLAMPTTRTMGQVEKLLDGITKLLDIRKVKEKVVSEVKILQAEKRLEQGLEPEAEPAGDMVNGDTKMDIDTGYGSAHDNEGNGSTDHQDTQDTQNGIDGQPVDITRTNEQDKDVDGNGVRDDIQDGASNAEERRSAGDGSDVEAAPLDETEEFSGLPGEDAGNGETVENGIDSESEPKEHSDNASEEGGEAVSPTVNAGKNRESEEPEPSIKEDISSEEEIDSPVPSRPSTRRGSVRNKRSASVMSTVSKGSNKRARK